MEPIILASSSPRRQDILKMFNIPFQVMMPEINEKDLEGIPVTNIPDFLARKKVDSIVKKLTVEREIPWVLGADTIIDLNGEIFGKPENHEQASLFLKKFQGKTHTVRTGIALYNGKKHLTVSRTAITRVTFAPMSDDEIEWYVSTGEWHGAAGGYRIQSIAQCFISKIDGSQSCVAGLPIFELFAMLKEQGYSIIE